MPIQKTPETQGNGVQLGRRAFLALGTSFSLASVANGQRPLRPTPPQAPLAALDPARFAFDDPARACLIVTPAEFTGPMEKRPTAEQLDDAARLGPIPHAAAFDRELFSLASLAALVPKTQTRLRTDLPEINPLDGLEPRDALTGLLASLTPRQWRAIGGNAGIERSDLDDDQRALFDVLRPDPWIVRQVTLDHGDYHSFRIDRSVAPTTLSKVQRDGARLRLRLRPKLNLETVKPSGIAQPDLPAIGLLPDGLVVWRTFEAERKPSADVGEISLIELSDADELPSDLAFNLPALAVSVGNLRAHATVRALVAAIAVAAKLDLRADKRFESLPIAYAGAATTARAGDLLRALARSVNGSWRDVSGTYLLAPDRVPVGIRFAKIAGWRDAFVKTRDAYLEAARRSLGNGERLYELPSVVGVPPMPESVKRAVFQRGRGMSGGAFGVSVPLSELSPEARGVAKQVFDREEGSVLDQPLDPDRARVQYEIDAEFLIDGIGIVTDPSRSASLVSLVLYATPLEAEPDLAQTFPETDRKNSVVLLAPRSEKSVEYLIDAAKRARLTKLWIQSPPGDAAIWKAARFVCARDPELSLGVARSPWDIADPARIAPSRRDFRLVDAPGIVNLPGKNAPNAPRRPAVRPDPRPFNAPENSLIPDAALQDAGLSKWIEEIVALSPTSLYLPWVAPIGYDVIPPASYIYARDDFGYASSMRAAFVRAEGVDPADLRGEDLSVDGLFNQPTLALPFLGRDDSRILAKWSAFRIQMARSSRDAILSRLRATLPACSIFVPGMVQAAELGPDNKPVSRKILVVPPNDARTSLKDVLAMWKGNETMLFSAGQKSDGYILDLRKLTDIEARDALRRLA